MKLTSISCSLTQEVSQEYSEHSSSSTFDLNELFACYAFQSGLLAFESYYWKLLLSLLLGPLLFANATLQHSEPSTNYSSDMKPREATVTDL